MSDKPTHRSGEKWQPGNNNAGPVTRGALAKMLEGEGGRSLGQLKGEDENIGRGLQLTSDVSHQFEDAEILQGESPAPLELESKSMVSTPILLAGLSPDCSASHILQQEEQVAEDETVGDELLSDEEGISTKYLSQHPVDVQSQDWSVRLPEDIVLTLFKFYLKPCDVLATSQTCQLWRRWGENDTLWEQKCKQAGLAFILTPANKRALKRRSEDTAIAYSAWKENFVKHYKIAKKFREGVPQIITIEMSNWVNHMEIFNNKIVTTHDKNINVFCALSGKLLHQLVEHTSQVSSIQMDDLSIVSGSDYGSVKVWDVDKGTCLHTMLGHTNYIACLQLHGAIAVSGSWDSTLRMWDIREGKCIRTLTGHTGWVYGVQFDGRRVVSGSRDKTIKIWDSETGECLRTLIHNFRFKSLKFNGVNVAVGYFDGSIKVWKVDTGICRHTLEGNDSWFMELEGDLLVCRGADAKTAKIWNISTGACLHTLAGPHKHIDIISGIQLSKKFVVTRSWDGTVKLWDIKTGEFIRDLVMESGGQVQKIRMENAKIVCDVDSGRKSKLLVLNFDTNDED